jgi:hypothetical protein
MMTFAEQKIIIERNQTRWPVPVIRIANQLGLKVYSRSDWPDNISGRIFASEAHGGTSGFAIEVNASHAKVRRRFTIAHEIAHFVLHKRLIGSELYDDGLYRSGLSNTSETQANRLAARILMPQHLIDEALELYGPDPARLSEEFGVSDAAMRIRLGLPLSH